VQSRICADPSRKRRSPLSARSGRWRAARTAYLQVRCPGFGGSTGPPAKHCAIDIQRVATSPFTSSAVSATLRTWVTT